jgi:Domain of unknown function (DUF5666)/Domain of unknown function (DUF4382)
MRRSLGGLAVLLLFSVFWTACGNTGGSVNTGGNSQTTQAMVYVTASDAPLPSVLSFQVTIQSITLYNGTTNVALMNTPTNIEFSRLQGLRTLLALNSVPAGTYTSATVTLASPIISYLDITTTPTSVSTINGTLLNNQVSYTFNQPLNVTANGLGGLHFHFNLHDSLQLDGSGQITGVVDPKIQIRPLTLNDPDSDIDEFRGSLVSVNAAGNSFVLQRPGGRQFTVKVDGNTQWEGTDTINTITPPAIIEIAGTVQADGSILATNVEVITPNHSFLEGLVLNATPSTGAATSVTVLVRDEIPVLSGIDVGKPATLNLNSNTVFDIYRFSLPVESFLFNNSMLVVGQRVTIVGDIDTSTSPASFDTRRVVLHRQGLQGTYVANSLQVTSGNNGQFMFNANGLHGYLFQQPIKVLTSNLTVFRNVTGGLSGVPNLTGSFYVVGLLLKDPNTGAPVMVAGRVWQAN